MREEVLGIGDMKVFDQPVLMKCFGLGSCVGLFVKDRKTGVTGGAHIFLPEASRDASLIEHMAADSCVKEMLQKMKSMGASLESTRAKIAGGSNVLRSFNEVGSKNTIAVIDALLKSKIYIVALDVGGFTSRTVEFDSASEKLTVHHLERNSTKIY